MRIGSAAPFVLGWSLIAIGPTVEAVQARPVRTERVIIVSVDGLAESEAWGAPGAVYGRSHPYLPLTWTRLVPLGTIWTDCRNWGITYTSPAHETIMSGVIQLSPNTRGERPSRSFAPTLTEAWRKETGAPASDTWIVHGKIHLDQLDWTLHPAYGPDYAASRILVEGGDEAVFDRVLEVLEGSAPHVMLVNLADVDGEGHTSDWSRYTNAIEIADRILVDLWDWIQSDPRYRNRTTLFVTADHGRHDDEHGGFTDHGGICSGCRSVPLLMVGPDTPPGLVVSTPVALEDIAPTAAYLLGLEMPTTEGKVLRGGILGWADEPRELRLSPSLAAADGGVVLSWVESKDGRSIVKTKRFDDVDGTLVGGPVQEHSRSGARATGTQLAARGSTVSLAWVDPTAAAPAAGLEVARSADGGRTWGDAEMAHAGSDEDWPRTRARMLWTPTGAVAADGTELLVVPALEDKLDLVKGPPWAGTTILDSLWKALNPSVAVEGDTLYLAFTSYSRGGDPGQGTHQLTFSRSLDGGATWSPPVHLTGMEDPVQSPVVLTGDRPGHVTIIYAQWRWNAAWQVRRMESEDAGVSWSRSSPVSPPDAVSEWQPTAVVAGGDLYVAWTDLAYTPSQVTVVSITGGRARLLAVFGDPERMSESPRLAAAPDGRVYLAWRDVSPGRGSDRLDVVRVAPANGHRGGGAERVESGSDAGRPPHRPEEG